MGEATATFTFVTCNLLSEQQSFQKSIYYFTKFPTSLLAEELSERST